ncbi:MAG TPA: alpha/beta hydrolase family protein [Candidatus Acidoferrales bacterium]
MSRFFRAGRLGAFLLVVTVAAIFAPVVHAADAGRAECRSMPSKILGHPVAYCVILPRGYDTDTATRYPVLYFLHGLGGNEQTLLESGGMNEIEDLRAANKISEFLVVAPNGGRSFFINSRDGHVRYEDFFIQEFIPFIESHYRIDAVRKDRGITGVSMGGYGSLRFGLKYPALFGSVSAHSAALIDKLPRFEGSEDQTSKIARVLGGSFGNPVDPKYWERESPFTIVKTGPKPANLPIYFDCGTDDDFGFNQGAQKFHDLLVSRGIPNEFHLYPGGHDMDYFADHLPASLEFHSHAFGVAPASK